MNPKSSVVGYYGSDLISDNLMERKRRDLLLFQNKISKLFNSTSIAGFSTPKVGKKDIVWELSERC